MNFNFDNKIVWLTVSNVFCKSRRTIPVNKPLSIFSLYGLSNTLELYLLNSLYQNQIAHHTDCYLSLDLCIPVVVYKQFFRKFLKAWEGQKLVYNCLLSYYPLKDHL